MPSRRKFDSIELVKNPSIEDVTFVSGKRGRHLPFTLRAQIITSYRRNLKRAIKETSATA